MSGLLSELTALPNLHPALVHFPIALAVTALAVDVLSLLFRMRERLGLAVALLYSMAALGGIATYLTGRQASDSVGQITRAAEPVLAEHADLALLTMIALILAAVLRVTATSVKKGRVATAVLSAAILVMVAANGLVAVTADRGGALVFRHDVAVSLQSSVDRAPGTEPAGVSNRQQLVQGDDGSLVWHPSALQGNSVGTVLRPAVGASAEVLSLSERVTDEADGVWVEVAGSTVVCLPGAFGDVVVTTTVDLGAFEGLFGVGHHIQSVHEGVFFTVNSNRDAELVRRADGESVPMDQGTVPESSGLVTLRTSVSGRHLRGQVDEATVVHGHGSSGDQGAVGLVLDGRGEIRIIQVSVEPAGEHSTGPATRTTATGPA